MLSFTSLLVALIAVESNGNPDAVGDGGKAIGILQIHAAVVEDVNRVYRTEYVWPRDAKNPTTAKQICELYLRYWMSHHSRKTGQSVSYEMAARIWNGGPTGPTKSATLPYYRKVAKHLPRP